MDPNLMLRTCSQTERKKMKDIIDYQSKDNDTYEEIYHNVSKKYIEFFTAGHSHYSKRDETRRQHTLFKVLDSTKVTIMHDKNNQFDSKALIVINNDKDIGWVPAKINTYIFDNLNLFDIETQKIGKSNVIEVRKISNYEGNTICRVKVRLHYSANSHNSFGRFDTL